MKLRPILLALTLSAVTAAAVALALLAGCSATASASLVLPSPHSRITSPKATSGPATPARESEAGAGSSGALVPPGGVPVPVPPQIASNFTRVLGPAVMGQLQAALRP